jgi:hypothetical protein
LVTFCWGVPESAACTVKLNVPAVVGVPVIAPVEAFRDRLAGRVVPPLRVQTTAPEPPVEARVTPV